MLCVWHGSWRTPNLCIPCAMYMYRERLCLGSLQSRIWSCFGGTLMDATKIPRLRNTCLPSAFIPIDPHQGNGIISSYRSFLLLQTGPWKCQEYKKWSCHFAKRWVEKQTRCYKNNGGGDVAVVLWHDNRGRPTPTQPTHAHICLNPRVQYQMQPRPHNLVCFVGGPWAPTQFQGANAISR